MTTISRMAAPALADTVAIGLAESSCRAWGSSPVRPSTTRPGQISHCAIASPLLSHDGDPTRPNSFKSAPSQR